MTSLEARIATAIAAQPQQRLTFAKFMDFALYDPEFGYYSSGRAAIGGEGGDFFTSASLGSDLGELLAVQFAEFWDGLGRPTSFTLLEMGAGTGALAADILQAIQRNRPDFLTALRYVIVEASPALRSRQQEFLTSRQSPVEVVWQDWSQIPDSSVVGCAFSNELVDALPVHAIEIAGDRLQEIYVTHDGKGFVEIRDAPSTPAIAEYFADFDLPLPGPAYPDGYRTEVNLAARAWLARVARKLQRGYLLTIDYGYPAAKYYHPQRYQGTLQCYAQHQRGNDPYIAVGERDITTHVNFTDLERTGDRLGLSRLGFTQQGLFLMALGLGERLATLSQSCTDPNELLSRRDALHQLIDPTGLGGFGVLLQGKGLTPEEGQLPQGFREPAMI